MPTPTATMPFKRYDPRTAYKIEYRHVDPTTGLIVSVLPTTTSHKINEN